MNLNDFRNAALSQVPVDTRNMLLNGFRFYETDLFMRCQADLSAVPYIYYNEEGTVFTQKNKGFFSKKMLGAVNDYVMREASGFDQTSNYTANEEAIRQNVLHVESGVLEKLG